MIRSVETPRGKGEWGWDPGAQVNEQVPHAVGTDRRAQRAIILSSLQRLRGYVSLLGRPLLKGRHSPPRGGE